MGNTDLVRRAADFIAKHEGCRLEIYTCPGGVKTIGYGHAIKRGEDFTKITKDEAHELLLKDTEQAMTEVTVANSVLLTDNQKIALTSFVFNVGISAYMKSTLRIKLQQGKITEAADEFNRWNKAKGQVLPGLVKRRAEERALFLTK